MIKDIEQAWEACQWARFEKETLEAEWREDKAHSQAEREWKDMDLKDIEEKLVFLDAYVAWQTKVLNAMRTRKFYDSWLDLQGELEEIWINHRTHELLEGWK